MEATPQQVIDAVKRILSNDAGHSKLISWLAGLKALVVYVGGNTTVLVVEFTDDSLIEFRTAWVS